LLIDWMAQPLPTTPRIARYAMLRYKILLRGHRPPNSDLCLGCNTRKGDGAYRVLADQLTPDMLLCEQCSGEICALPVEGDGLPPYAYIQPL